MSTYRIDEVLEDNIIIAYDADAGVMVTANGSYLQVWSEALRGGSRFNCLDAQWLESDNGLHSITAADLIDRAQAYLREVVGPEDEE